MTNRRATVVAEMPSPVESGTDTPDEKLAATAGQPANGAPHQGPPADDGKAFPTPVERTALPGIAQVMNVTLSKPDKILWPDAGKEKARPANANSTLYYEAVGEWMLPHLQGCPCSLLRAPDGIAGQQFLPTPRHGGDFQSLHPREGQGGQGPLCADRPRRGARRRGADRGLGDSSVELRAR